MPMKSILLALVLMVASGAVRAQQQNLILVELFTSQACSSCPPADALLPEIDEMPGVLALAFHVDYWNYLGWEDTFSSAKNSARQEGYARKMHKRSLYTPQMVVQGREALVGHKAKLIAQAVHKHMQAGSPVLMEAQREGGIVLISIAPSKEPVRGEVDISIVRYIPSQSVEIRSGENAGREITYHNVVSDWDTVARWDGKQTLDLRYEGLGTDPVAVIAQMADMGPVLSAASLP